MKLRASILTAQRGFSLVEVLIVAVIMGILAAVAVPAYLGFVTNQKKATVKALAQTAAVNANVMSRKGVAITSGNILASLFLPNASAYTVSINAGTRYVIIADASNNSIIDSAAY